MKVTQPVLDYENKPILDKDSPTPLTWRVVINTALNNTNPGETLTDEEKSKCFHLSVKTFLKEDVEFSLEERAFILKRIKKIYIFPLVCGRAEEFFK